MDRNERNIQLIKDKDYETLLQENGGLVKDIVFKKIGNKKEFDMDDIISLGMFALYKAALKFDVDKGTNFSTYAGSAVMNELLLYIRNSKKSIKAMSIEELLYKSDPFNDTHIKDRLADENIYNNIDYIIKVNNFYDLVEYAKENILNKNERYVFDAYYRKTKLQREISNDIGVNQVQVSRIYRRACNKIKNYLLSKGVDQYFFN